VTPVPDAPNTPEIQGMSQDFAQYQQMITRFIEVANQMKDEGQPPPSVNAALMLASGLYATYLAVGNEGRLEAKAVDQVAGVYRKNLAALQKLK
jgi:hypothetical protein